ncbi:MAG: hypothetical protein AB8F95_14210 [Bacteroidia bacterium]
MTYARARVFTGMISIGWWVLLCILALFLDASGEIARYEGESRSAAILLVFVLGYIVLGLPFDVLGGYVLPRKFERPAESFSQWFAKWSRGVLLHGALLWSFGMIIMSVADWFGVVAAIATVGVIMLFQARFQLWLGQLLSPMKLAYTSTVGNGEVEDLGHLRFAVLETEEQNFTGGIVGRPGKETIVLPAQWQKMLKPELMEIVTAGRLGAIMSGSRNRGLVFAIVWNLIGFALATMLSPHALASAAGVIDVALIFSLFTFVGMFGILPFFSRRGTLEVDSWTREQGLCPFELQRVMSFHNKQRDDNATRPTFLEFFCHPIPSVENRLQNLLLEEEPKGAWHVARQSLFLSWAGLSLLSRSAHCNLGRPELWVILPCD